MAIEHKPEIKNTDSVIGIIGNGMVGGTMRQFYENVGDFYKEGELVKIRVLVNDSMKDRSKNSLKEIAQEAEIIFLCVPTPNKKDKKGIDLSIVEKALADLIAFKPIAKVVVIRSTVTPGTTDRLQKQYPEINLAFMPEFLTEARALEDVTHPDGHVYGYTGQSVNFFDLVASVLPEATYGWRKMPASWAEAVKLFRNAWYTTKVVKNNQEFNLCQKMGWDYFTIRDAVIMDKRMTGTSHTDIFHEGGRGAGGKCLPKDLSNLIDFADENGVSLGLLKKVKEINDKLLISSGKGHSGYTIRK